MEQKKNDLYHHGILGMKWGVRRFQNYDGSYTKRGLARYNKASEDYESAKKVTSSAKAAYKAGTGSKAAIKDARNAQRQAKKALDKSYDKLKQDKLADQGKDLYSKGKTITYNYEKARYTEIGIMVASRLVGSALSRSGASFTTRFGNVRISSLAPAAIVAGGTAVNFGLAAKNNYEARRLRAYYGHH